MVQVGLEGGRAMEHTEAIEKMAAERYLLGELAPEELEAFEEHVFDCPDCILDLRAGEAFVAEAKVQLPELTTAVPTPRPKENGKLTGLRGCVRPLPRPFLPRCCSFSVTRIWLPIRRCALRQTSRGCFPGFHCTKPRVALT